MDQRARRRLASKKCRSVPFEVLPDHPRHLRRRRRPSSSAAPVIASGEAFASTGAEPPWNRGARSPARWTECAEAYGPRLWRGSAAVNVRGYSSTGAQRPFPLRIGPPENWAPRMGRSQNPRSAGVLVRSDTGDGSTSPRWGPSQHCSGPSVPLRRRATVRPAHRVARPPLGRASAHDLYERVEIPSPRGLLLRRHHGDPSPPRAPLLRHRGVSPNPKLPPKPSGPVLPFPHTEWARQLPRSTVDPSGGT